MKYIKKYEENIISPRMDYYVVVCEENNIPDEVSDFLSKNVGKVVNIQFKDNPTYIIKYENITEELYAAFRWNTKGQYMNLPYTMTVDLDQFCRPMNIEEIIYCSPIKEDCEDYIAARKFNI